MPSPATERPSIYSREALVSDIKETASRCEDVVGIILHRDGVVVDLDEQTAAVFGYRRNELIGRVLADLIAGSGQPVSVNQKKLTGVHRDGTHVPLEVLPRTRSGNC